MNAVNIITDFDVKSQCSTEPATHKIDQKVLYKEHFILVLPAEVMIGY